MPDETIAPTHPLRAGFYHSLVGWIFALGGAAACAVYSESLTIVILSSVQIVFGGLLIVTGALRALGGIPD